MIGGALLLVNYRGLLFFLPSIRDGSVLPEREADISVGRIPTMRAIPEFPSDSLGWLRCLDNFFDPNLIFRHLIRHTTA